MNYRHAFHAGNFADVVKHAVLARIVAYLKDKPAAFRVIDTHAGAGIYDLGSAEASRTGEWRAGIGKLLAAELPQAVRDLLGPYLDAVASFNPGAATGGALKIYPGSPALVRHWLRAQDRMIVCEAEPAAARALSGRMHGDNRVKPVAIDGYTALNAYVPPKERRGLVLIDPPFEAKDEFEKLGDAFSAAFVKWPTGIYVIWYPAKSRRATDTLAQLVARTAAAAKPPGKCLRLEFSVAPQLDGAALTSAGLLIVNPPYTLHGELKTILPELEIPLGQGGAARFRLEVPRP